MYYIYGISWPSTYSLSTLWYFWWPLPIFSFSVSDFCFSFSFQLSVYIFRFLHFHLPYISKLPPEAVEKDLFNVHPMKKMNKQPPTCGWSVWYYSIPIVPASEAYPPTLCPSFVYKLVFVLRSDQHAYIYPNLVCWSSWLRHVRVQASTSIIITSIKNNWIKFKDEVGMAIPKSIQTRFVGIRDNHNHYTSLRLLFE